MERRFYIYKRAKVYYAKLIDPRTGVMLNARAIGRPRNSARRSKRI